MGAPFYATMFRYPGKGGWTFVEVPEDHAPPVTAGWGRTPVRATVDGQTWDTSTWWDSASERTLLAIPKKIRAGKEAGQVVEVCVEMR